jgi:hypothetical protein
MSTTITSITPPSNSTSIGMKSEEIFGDTTQVETMAIHSEMLSGTGEPTWRCGSLLGPLLISA